MKFATDRHRPEGDWVQATIAEKVQGVHFKKPNADAFAKAAQKAESKGLHYGLSLEPEPDNPHDKNAVAVYGHAEVPGLFGKKAKRWQIGYLSKDLAAEMVKEFYAKSIPIAAELYSIWRSDNGFLDFSLIVLAPPGHSHSNRIKGGKKKAAKSQSSRKDTQP